MNLFFAITSIGEIHWLQSYFKTTALTAKNEVYIYPKLLRELDNRILGEVLDSLNANLVTPSSYSIFTKLDKYINNLSRLTKRLNSLGGTFFKIGCVLADLIASRRYIDSIICSNKYDYIFTSNSCPFNSFLELTIAYNENAKVIIFPHAQAIFSSYSYSDIRPNRQYSHWLEPSILSDWSLVCNKKKTIFVGAHPSKSYFSAFSSRKKKVLLILPKRPESSGFSIHSLESRLFQLIEVILALGYQIDFKASPKQTEQMNYLCQRLLHMGCIDISSLFSLDNFEEYVLSFGPFTTMYTYSISYGTPSVVLMPDDISVKDTDASFLIQPVTNQFTNYYFLSYLYHPIYSQDLLQIKNILINRESSWLQLLELQRQSLLINWPTTCFNDILNINT
ncbi:hypothetical protein N9Z61_02730 [bacterium]|nr:hypothetical protein [bacterium]